MTRKRRSGIWVVSALLLAALLSVSVAASDASVTASAPDSAAPGDVVEVSFEITNSGDENGSHYLDVEKPEEWEIVSRDDDGADWSPALQSWNWDNIEPGASRNPAIRLQIPDDEESGTYEVTGIAGDAGGDEDSTTETITVDSESTPTPTPSPTPTETPSPTPTGTPTPTSTPTPTPTSTPTPSPTPTGTPSPTPTGTPSLTPTEGDNGSTPTPTDGDDDSTPTSTADDPTPSNGPADPTPSEGGAGDDTATGDDSDDSLMADLPLIDGGIGLAVLGVLAAIAVAALLIVSGTRVLEE